MPTVKIERKNGMIEVLEQGFERLANLMRIKFRAEDITFKEILFSPLTKAQRMRKLKAITDEKGNVDLLKWLAYVDVEELVIMEKGFEWEPVIMDLQGALFRNSRIIPTMPGLVERPATLILNDRLNGETSALPWHQDPKVSNDLIRIRHKKISCIRSHLVAMG